MHYSWWLSKQDGSILGHQIFDCVGAQPRAAGRWKQHLLVTTRRFAQPRLQDGECGFGERRASLFAAFADDPDVGAHPKGDRVPRERRSVRTAEAAGAKACPSLQHKRITPHCLRHTSAMELLQAGVDRSVIALWLGHESVETTQIYLEATLAMKERALAKTTPLNGGRFNRYRPGDELLGFLSSL